MPGNLNKAQAKRLLADVLRDGQEWVRCEIAAAVFDLSTGAFEKWRRSDPNAPKPERWGRRKLYRSAHVLNHPGPNKRNLDCTSGGDAGCTGVIEIDPLMEAIRAARAP